jgi:hypothetical protein
MVCQPQLRLFLLIVSYGMIWLAPYMEIGRNARWASLLIFSLGLLTSRNLKDMSISAKQAPHWKMALLERVQSHRFKKIHWPPSYLPADVTSDSNHWIK